MVLLLIGKVYDYFVRGYHPYYNFVFKTKIENWVLSAPLPPKNHNFSLELKWNEEEGETSQKMLWEVNTPFEIVLGF